MGTYLVKVTDHIWQKTMYRHVLLSKEELCQLRFGNKQYSPEGGLREYHSYFQVESECDKLVEWICDSSPSVFPSLQLDSAIADETLFLGKFQITFDKDNGGDRVIESIIQFQLFTWLQLELFREKCFTSLRRHFNQMGHGCGYDKHMVKCISYLPLTSEECIDIGEFVAQLQTLTI